MQDVYEFSFLFVVLAFATVMNASWWIIFEKASKPGWAALVPIYNLIVMLEVSGKPGWWCIFFFIPCLSLLAPVFLILMFVDLAKHFGKGTGTVIGLILMPYVFVPVLAFGRAQYSIPEGA